MDIHAVCERINKYLDKNQSWAHVEPYGGLLPVVEAEIIWGDWKHDHWRLRWLMEEIGAMHIGSVVTEEDGSDCYSAIHRFVVSDDILKEAE